MKRSMLVLLTLVPVITGYTLNITLLIPGLGSFLYYFLPCITLLFWFYLGSRYAKSQWNILQSTIIGNGIGFLSLLIYFGQFWWCSNADRNLVLAAFSQNFVATTNLITARFALLFEVEKNTISMISSTAMQIMGLLLMVLIFLAGYVFGKNRGFNMTGKKSERFLF